MPHYKRYLDSFAAALIVVILTVLCFLCFYPSNSHLSKFIGVLIAYAFFLAFSIITAIIIILKKSSKGSKLKYDFLYNFVGTLNIIVGFTGLVLATFDIDTNLIGVIVSCILGLIIYHDIYFLKSDISRWLSQLTTITGFVQLGLDRRTIIGSA